MELSEKELKAYGVVGTVIIKSMTVGQEGQLAEEVDKQTRKLGYSPIGYATRRLLNFCVEEAPFATDMESLKEQDSALAEYIAEKYNEMCHPLSKTSSDEDQS